MLRGFPMTNRFAFPFWQRPDKSSNFLEEWKNHMTTLLSRLKAEIPEEELKDRIDAIAKEIEFASVTVEEAIRELTEKIESYLTHNPPFPVAKNDVPSDSNPAAVVISRFDKLARFSVLTNDDSIMYRWGIQLLEPNNFNKLLMEQDSNGFDKFSELQIIVGSLADASQKDEDNENRFLVQKKLEKLVKQIVESFQKIAGNPGNSECKEFEKLVNQLKEDGAVKAAISTED